MLHSMNVTFIYEYVNMKLNSRKYPSVFLQANTIPY